MQSGDKVIVENVNHPGQASNADAAKYAAMRSALMEVLPAGPPGLTQKEMAAAVVPHLPEEVFPGGKTAGWWAKTVQLDLEAKNLVARTDTKPLTWHRS